MHVFGPQFFRGESSPNFWSQFDAGSDHVAKFRGDRQRELGDYALKKKEKHHERFIRPPVTPYGRPKYRTSDVDLTSLIDKSYLRSHTGKFTQ